MTDRIARKDAFKLASAVVALATDLLDCLAACEREAIREAKTARRQAGRLMMSTEPVAALRRYERGLSEWLERFA